MIKEIILKMIEKDIMEHHKKNVIYVTQVTQCLRKSFYEITYKPKTPMDEVREYLIIGKSVHTWLESLLNDYAKEMNINYECEKKIEYEYRGYIIKGKADIIMDNVLIELKTTHRDIGIPHFTHILQANEYAYQLNIPKFIILYITPKDLVEFEFKTDKIRHVIFMKRLNELIKAIETGEPPKRESGYECKNCPYIHKCKYKRLM